MTSNAGQLVREIMTPLKFGWYFVAVSLTCGWLCLPANAHPEGLSGLHVTIAGDRLRAAITLHTRDFNAWFPAVNYPDYVADVCREMERTVDEIIEVQVDQEVLSVTAVKAFLLEVGLIELDVDFVLPTSATPVELLVWSKHLIHMPRGHQQILIVEDRRGIATAEEHGVIQLEDLLTVERDAAATKLPAGRQSNTVTDDVSPATIEPSPSRISFFWFGFEHIRTGYDHLLFLAALLLVCSTFKEAAAIITCFTIAHSITLALAALNVVRISTSIVEPAIALSIVYVAIENLFRTPPLWQRATITCGFGLIHGLGFASALREIGLATLPGSVFWPLLKFNLGVETGQLCVAAVCLPIFLVARKRERWNSILTIGGSLLIALCGGYWFWFS